MIDVLRSLPTEEQQGIGIFATHGLADAGTTLAAAASVGPSVEANPLIRVALEEGFGFAAGVMLLVVGAASVLYPTLSEYGEFPDWFGWAVIVVGAVVAIGNLGVVLA